MKDLQAVIQRLEAAKDRSTVPGGLPINSKPLEEPQKALVADFFALVRVTYGESKYRSCWPNEEAELAAMRMWGPKIAQHGADQLKEMIRVAAGLGNAWPDIGAILSVGTGGRTRLGPEWVPIRKPGAKARARGRLELDRMRNLLGGGG